MIQIGRLKENLFPAGVYIYTGSHQKYLMKRVERHLRKAKKVHWHIDYLTTQPDIGFRNIILFPASREECRLNQLFREFSGGVFRHPGFGSSDCRNQCASHLLYLPRLPDSRVDEWINSVSALNPVRMVFTSFGK